MNCIIYIGVTFGLFILIIAGIQFLRWLTKKGYIDPYDQ